MRENEVIMKECRVMEKKVAYLSCEHEHFLRDMYFRGTVLIDLFGRLS